MDQKVDSPRPDSGPTTRAISTRRVIEQRSIDYVPNSERHGKAWHLWPVWFCGDAHLTTLAVGVIGLSLGANFFWAAVAILAGCAFGTLFMAAHSAQGPHMGLPQLIQSRPQFGYVGALLVFIVAIATYIGYNAFNQILAGQTFQDTLGLDPGSSSLGFTILAMVMAFLGYSWFHKVQRYLSYVLIAAMLVFTVYVMGFASWPAEQLTATGFQPVPFLAQFFTAAAYQLSWSIYVSDYSRYLPRTVSTRATFWWTYLGATVGGSWMMLIGAAAAALSPELNVAQALIVAGDGLFAGFGSILVILAVIGLITSAAQNFYGASLTILSTVDSIKPIRATPGKRLVALIFAGILAVAIARSASENFLTDFGSFLAVMLYLFTPWTAINLIDYYFVRKGHYSIVEIFSPRGMYGRWSWRGIFAYFAGFLAMAPFFVTIWWTGPIAQALGGADIAMIPGLIVSAGVYLLVYRGFDLAAEQRLIAQQGQPDEGNNSEGIEEEDHA